MEEHRNMRTEKELIPEDMLTMDIKEDEDEDEEEYGVPQGIECSTGERFNSLQHT